MVDLTPYLNRTTALIDRWYEQREAKRGGEQYPTLRVSELGEACARKLWYKFNWVLPPEKFNGKQLRLFDRGNLEEERFIRPLIEMGVQVFNEQQEVTACDGWLTGHIDGMALGLPEGPKTPHLLEFKTHGQKSYDDLVKNKVQKSKFRHFVQTQVYAYLLGITRIMYLAVNKNTDQIYQERYETDKKFAEAQISRAERIIYAGEPPQRISENPQWFECKFCYFRDVCHNGQPYYEGNRVGKIHEAG